MEVIVYEGPHLSEQDMEILTRQISLSQEVDLTVHHCDSTARLFLELDRMAKQENIRKEPVFTFRAASGGVQLLKLSQIYYFRGSGHRVSVVFEDGRELEGRTVRESTAKLLDPLVKSGQFLRIYRACYINTDHITSITPTSVMLDNGVTMKVSHQRYRAFVDSYRPI